MTALSTVRIGTMADHQEIWRLFLMGHKENGLFRLAPDKVEFFMLRCLQPDLIPPGDTGPRGVIGVIGAVGSLEALVFVSLSCFWYTHDKNIDECIVYVDPEYRRSGHAQALIQWMKDQVEVTNLPLMTGIISNERTEAKCRLYRRMLPKIGEFFYLAPKGGMVPALTATSS
jgi:GNAT superfamily N-acetyltransferase